jgi:O-antigen ligase
LVEVAGILVGFTAAATLAPATRSRLVVAAVVGALVGALLAIADIRSVHDVAMPVVQDPGRLTGPYRNPNYLAFAVGSAAPLLVGAVRYLGGVPRMLAAAALLLSVGTVVASFSRAGVACTAVAMLISGGLSFRRRQTVVRVLAVGFAVLAVGGAVGIAAFERGRTEADLGEARRNAAAMDVSGWDGTARGPIPAGPSDLSNAGSSVLSIASDKAGEGVSIPIGPLVPGRHYALSFRGSSPSQFLPIRFRLRDDMTTDGGTEGQGGLSATWRRFTITWRPKRRPRQSRFYVWQSAGPSRIYLSSPVLTRPDGTRETLDVRLRGSVLSKMPAVYSDDVSSSLESRREALELSLRAFWSSPVLGIGWQRFPHYAAPRATFGALATHNEYLRVLAELGLIGVLALAGAALAVASGVRAIWAHEDRAGPLGALVAGAFGLLFVNAFVTPPAMLPFAAALAAVVATQPRRAREHGGG